MPQDFAVGLVSTAGDAALPKTSAGLPKMSGGAALATVGHCLCLLYCVRRKGVHVAHHFGFAGDSVATDTLGSDPVFLPYISQCPLERCDGLRINAPV